MISRQRSLIAGLLFVFLAACGGGDDGGDNGPTGPTPDFTIAVSPTSATVSSPSSSATAAATVAQRGTVDLQVTITRTGGFSGSVTVDVTGLPTGVTASALTIPGTSGTGTITLTASAGAVAGTSTLTVQGSATGLTAKTASVSLTVEKEPPPSSGSIGVSLSASTVMVTQGQGTDITVALTRTDFAGEISLAASSDPAGVTTAFDPATTTGVTSTLTVSAGASLSPGNYTVTVTASGAGVADATSTLSVTVNQSSSGGSIMFTYCEASGLPDWFAVKDGDGAWMQVTPDPPNTFSFDINASTGGIATVTEASGEAQLQVILASKQEIEAFATGQCPGSGVTKTVMGSVAGLQATEQASINMGGAFASAGLGQTQFTLAGVNDGPVDLLASAVAIQTQTVTGMIIRRDLNPADGSTLPVLDFGSSEAFAPSVHTVTVNNAMGQQTLPAVLYVTANGAISTAFFQSFGGNQFFGVPPAHQATGDLHWLTVTAFTDQQADNIRLAARFFEVAADQTITLGPQLSQPTISVAATAPYVQPRVELATQDEYESFWTVQYLQNDGPSAGFLVLEGYGVGSTLDLTVPDFSGVSGWSNDWGMQAGTQVQWFVLSTGWNTAGFGGLPGFSDGNFTQSASRTGTINP
jgi:hypothetical protein